MRPSPAKDRAIAFLREQVARLTGTGTRLPRITVLAAQASVAPATMWAAVRELCRDGVLVARQRSGIRLAGPFVEGPRPNPSRPPAGSSGGQRWERIRDEIEADVTRGEFPLGEPLPGPKTLAQRYGVCRQTLRKALSALERERVLVVRRKTYWVGGGVSNPAPATVFFVEWVTGAEVQESLDRECSRLGVRLQTQRYIPQERLYEALAAVRKGQSAGPVIGYLLSITGGSPAQYRRVLEEIVPVEKPVAILDQDGGATGVSLPGGRALRVFTIASHRAPGQRMGRYLLALGHRRVAWLSAAHETAWSQHRLEGLRETFGRAGISDGVLAFTARDPAPTQSATEIDQDIAWLTDRVLARDRPRHRRLARSLRRLRPELAAAMRWSYVEDALLPLMEKALAAPGVTAWVAANDPMALTCLEFLRSRGVRVPEEISVVGFDDIAAAYNAGLTSYNFNRRAAVRAVVAYLVSGVQPGTGVRGRTVEIEGFVTPRATSGQASAGR